MAALQGCAKRIRALLKLADHTYVTSADGYAWGCWGGNSGGSVISTGTGSSAQANCISQPSSHAGIIYGVTGVCHQTANRILWPASILVSRAKGYWASHLAYGTYGTDLEVFLNKLRTCPTSLGEMSPRRGRRVHSPKAGKVAADPKDRALVRDIKALYLQSVSPQEARRRVMVKGATDPKLLSEETRLVMQHRLGRTVKAAKIKNVQTIQGDLFSAKDDIGQRLYQGKLSGEELAQKMNAEVKKALRDCLKALGSDDYTQLLQLKPGETINIVDPKIAAKAYQ